MVFRDQSLDTEKWSLLLGQLPFLLNTNITVSTYVWKYEEEAGHYRSLSAWVFGASDYLSWHISYCKERVLVSCWCWPVAKLCPTLCSPMNCSTLGFPIVHYLSLLKLMFIELVMPSNHLILCCPLLLLPSIYPIIRVFSNESALRIRWPKYWSFSFSISPSNECSGLISFRMDWFDLFAVQGTLKRQHRHQACRQAMWSDWRTGPC